MTRQEALKDFVSQGVSQYGDYWEMQLGWACYVDALAGDGMITERQRCSWGNPTTPEGFASWQRRNA